MALVRHTFSNFGALNPISLRFFDRNAERRFQRQHLLSSLWVIRLALFFGFLIYGLFSVLDAYVGQEATGKLWFIRFGFVMPVMASVAALTFTRLFLRWSQTFLAFATFVSGFGVVLMTAVTPAPVSHWYYAGLSLVIVYVSSVIRLHYAYSLGVSVVLVGLYQVSAIVVNPVPGEVLINNNAFLVVSVAVAALTNYLQEFYMRTRFAQTLLLRSEKAQSDRLRRRAEQLNEDLKQKERALARAQRIARLGSWEWDLDKDEIRMSEEAKRILGLDVNLSTINFGERLAIVHPDDRDMVAEVLRAALDEPTDYDLEHRIVRADGTMRVVHEQGELVFDGRGRAVSMSGTTHDFTERHRMDDDLRAATMAAETANEAKSQFLANMSHELRTPLNAIIGYSELLSEDAEEKGDSSTVEDLYRINTAGRHLLALVNDILDLSKIEAGKMELSVEPFDVEQLVRDVQETVRPLIDRNGNRFVVDCTDGTGEMTSDATKLRQVLYNLLSNAAKFTEGGEIRMRVSREPASNGSGATPRMVFAVSDTGIGIPPDQVDAVFNAFKQSRSSDSGIHGGTGLGLAISRHYCSMMGGTITAQSKAGAGTTFTVRLPAKIMMDRSCCETPFLRSAMSGGVNPG